MYCLPCVTEVNGVRSEAIWNSVDVVVPLVVGGDALEIAMSSTTVVSEPEKEKNPYST